MAKNFRSQENLTLWSWNCRSLKNKHASLTQYVRAALIQPDVICLQEAGKGSKPLTGYRLLSDSADPRVALLVKKDLAVTYDSHSTPEITSQTLTIWPAKKGRPKVVICNVYSPPQARSADFDRLLYALNTNITGNDRLFFLGDFNAWSTTWGYRVDRPKGTKLLEVTQHYNLELLTPPGVPTRLGNSVTGDTTPDLAFTNNMRQVQWNNLGETLGSDHFITQIQCNATRFRRPLGKTMLTDWKKYRDAHENRLHKPATAQEWGEYITEIHAKFTKTYQATVDRPAIDNHLAHLWEARRGLVKRWKRQRLNRKLEQRIAQLTDEANTYAAVLTQNNWRTFCDSLKGTLGTKKNLGHLACHDRSC